MVRGLSLTISLALLVLGAGGCDDLIRGIVPVRQADTIAELRDAGLPDGDATIPDYLTVTAVTPTHGPFIGGNVVTIHGSGFDKGTEVRIGGKEIQVGETTVLSPVAIAVIAPAGEVGPADIEVTTSGGGADDRATLEDAYRYDPVYLDPSSGPSAGGTLVTIHGAGTAFAPGVKVELGGQEMIDVEVVSATTLRAKTAPHPDGPVKLVIGAGADEVTVEEVFTYYGSTNPHSGGMGGGPIQGTLTVSVLNWLTRQPVALATVFVHKDRDLQLSGQTDAKGVVVFSDPQLAGPVTVTAGKPQHETTTMVEFDARDVTIFLYPIIPPQPGEMPPGQRMGLIEGYVIFGGSTGAGSTQWKIVPEPKVGQVKRVHVFVTNSAIRFAPPFTTPTSTIDFEPGDTTAWPYSLNSRLGTLAVYAVAGLYHEASDRFEPYAMGITRGIVIGPGERKVVNVLVNIPLTEQVTVEIKNPPAQVNRHRLRLAIDLGAEGYLLRRDMQVEADGIPTKVRFGRLPSFTKQGLTDGAYGVDLLLDEASSPSGLPIVKATNLSVQPDAAGVILLDGLLGPPQQVKPGPGGLLEGNTLRWSYQGEASVAITAIERSDQTPLWRVISPGDVTEVKLPDPKTVGLPAWPNTSLVWLQWQVRLPDFDIDTFNYSQLRSQYWDRWSYDEFSFKVNQP